MACGCADHGRLRFLGLTFAPKLSKSAFSAGCGDFSRTLVVALRLHHTSLKHQIDFIENVTSFPRNVTLPKQMIQFHISPTDLQHQVGQGPLSFPLVFCRSISVALIWDIRILSRFLGSTYLPEPRKT